MFQAPSLLILTWVLMSGWITRRFPHLFPVSTVPWMRDCRVVLLQISQRHKYVMHTVPGGIIKLG